MRPMPTVSSAMKPANVTDIHSRQVEPTARTYRAISEAMTKVLRPIVRMLLRNGVTYQAFAETLKVVFVQVANEEFRIANRKQSDSRIAVITGLSRKEVKRVAALAPAADAESYVKFNRAARVIAGWTHDREYAEQGTPRVLSLEGGSPSFAELVRRYSGDAPPRAVLDELERVGAVERSADDRLSLKVRSYQPKTDDADRIAMMGDAVSALIETCDRNLDEGSALRLQRFVTQAELPTHSVARFEGLAVERAKPVFDGLSAWLEDHGLEPGTAGVERKRVGVGIYLFVEER
jgi:hypothetical protein